MINFKKNPVISGTILLSFSGLICRGIGFFYRLFISQAFGEEAMGIFQLTSPILMLAFSLTCAGMQTAISKYTASCFAVNDTAKATKFLITGCSVSLFLSLLYSIIIYGQAENISIFLLQEKRCAPLLRICALSFPLSAMHSCFNGYFYGKRETRIPSFTQIIEQIFRTGSVLCLYYFFLSLDKPPTIVLTCIGMFLGELLSFTLSFFAFLSISRKEASSHIKTKTFDTTSSFGMILRQLLELSLPLTLNRVLVNLLQSYEAISIPVCLRKYGYSAQTSLSIYGVLTGMALSLVLFPSTFTNSASVLLLPTISQAASGSNTERIRYTIKQSILFSSILGAACTLFFLIFGDFCGTILFDSTLAGSFIRQLSFLCPFLYLHTTLSSILNGLKKTGITLFINVSSLVIQLFFTLFFIPQWGIQGYLWGLLFSEIFSSLCCTFFLKKYIFL